MWADIGPYWRPAHWLTATSLRGPPLAVLRALTWFGGVLRLPAIFSTPLCTQHAEQNTPVGGVLSVCPARGRTCTRPILRVCWCHAPLVCLGRVPCLVSRMCPLSYRMRGLERFRLECLCVSVRSFVSRCARLGRSRCPVPNWLSSERDGERRRYHERV